MKNEGIMRIFSLIFVFSLFFSSQSCSIKGNIDSDNEKFAIGYRELDTLPLFVDSKDDFSDTSKQYVLPDGTIWTYTEITKGMGEFNNLLLSSTDKNGDTVGIIEDHRYRSSDELVEAPGANATGFIPVKPNDTIRFMNINFRNENLNGIGPASIYLRFYDSSFNCIAQSSPYVLENDVSSFSRSHILDNKGNLSEFTLNDKKEYSYMRLSYVPDKEETAIITVNEEILTDVDPYYEWTDEEYLSADWCNEIISANEVITSIKNNSDEGIAQFIFTSDIHLDPTGYNYNLLKNIGKVAAGAMSLCRIPFIMSTGDISTQSSGYMPSDFYENLDGALELFKPIPENNILLTVGNHDGATGSKKTDNETLYYCYQLNNRQRAKLYFGWQKTNTYKKFGGDGTFYYIDDSVTKTRYIMLNSFWAKFDGDEDGLLSNMQHSFMHNPHLGPSQLNWLCNEALDMPEGYAAVIGTHNAYSPKDKSVLFDIISAYQNKTVCKSKYEGNMDWQSSDISADFTEAKGEIIAIFQGHDHRDAINTEEYPVPCITITTAGADIRDENPEERIPGTATETALDIVTIDKSKRIIYLTRLGVGEDREITY